MTIKEFKKLTKEQIIEYGKTIPFGSIYDDNGNRISYRDKHDFWFENTYDDNNKEASHIDSFGYWGKSTYEDGIRTSYRDKDGNYIVKNKFVSKEEYKKFMKG